METPRQRARQRTMDDIVRLGREQLATVTPAELSLRAIARELGIVSSAIYRYVKDRDELLTLLIVDAYDELGAQVEAAVTAASRRSPRGQLLAVAHALRAWALREPSRFALLYGTPVPGYRAPGERTIGPGTRVPVALIEITEDAYREGKLADVAPTSLPRSLRRDMDAIRREYSLTVPAHVLACGVGVWSAMTGAVIFELFGQYGENTLSDPADFFEFHITRLAEGMGL